MDWASHYKFKPSVVGDFAAEARSLIEGSQNLPFKKNAQFKFSDSSVIIKLVPKDRAHVSDFQSLQSDLKETYNFNKFGLQSKLNFKNYTITFVLHQEANRYVRQDNNESLEAKPTESKESTNTTAVKQIHIQLCYPNSKENIDYKLAFKPLVETIESLLPQTFKFHASGDTLAICNVSNAKHSLQEMSMTLEEQVKNFLEHQLLTVLGLQGAVTIGSPEFGIQRVTVKVDEAPLLKEPSDSRVSPKKRKTPEPVEEKNNKGTKKEEVGSLLKHPKPTLARRLDFGDDDKGTGESSGSPNPVEGLLAPITMENYLDAIVREGASVPLTTSPIALNQPTAQDLIEDQVKEGSAAFIESALAQIQHAELMANMLGLPLDELTQGIRVELSQESSCSNDSKADIKLKCFDAVCSLVQDCSIEKAGAFIHQVIHFHSLDSEQPLLVSMENDAVPMKETTESKQLAVSGKRQTFIQKYQAAKEKGWQEVSEAFRKKQAFEQGLTKENFVCEGLVRDVFERMTTGEDLRTAFDAAMSNGVLELQRELHEKEQKGPAAVDEIINRFKDLEKDLDKQKNSVFGFKEDLLKACLFGIENIGIYQMVDAIVEDLP